MKRSGQKTIRQAAAALCAAAFFLGAATLVGGYGFCWSAVPGSQVSGRPLYFHSSRVYPLNYVNRACGFGVRSSQE